MGGGTNGPKWIIIHVHRIHGKVGEGDGTGGEGMGRGEGDGTGEEGMGRGERGWDGGRGMGRGERGRWGRGMGRGERGWDGGIDTNGLAQIQRRWTIIHPKDTCHACMQPPRLSQKKRGHCIINHNQQSQCLYVRR